jgi:hypothetical protein
MVVLAVPDTPTNRTLRFCFAKVSKIHVFLTVSNVSTNIELKRRSPGATYYFTELLQLIQPVFFISKKKSNSVDVACSPNPPGRLLFIYPAGICPIGITSFTSTFCLKVRFEISFK